MKAREFAKLLLDGPDLEIWVDEQVDGNSYPMSGISVNKTPEIRTGKACSDSSLPADNIPYDVIYIK